MKKTAIWLACALIAVTASASPKRSDLTLEKSVPFVSTASRGKDVRDVLHQIFRQTKNNYILNGVSRTELYLVLENLPFDEALAMICRTASLTYELENGIYTISPARKFEALPAKKTAADEANNTKTPASENGQPNKVVAPASITKLLPPPQGGGVPTVNVPPAKPTITQVTPAASIPAGKLSASVLKRTVTGKFNKTDLREIIAQLGSQAKVKIEVDGSVPKYALDFYLGKTSLGWALNTLAKNLGLQVIFSDGQKIILKPKK